MTIDFVPDIKNFPHICETYKKNKLITFIGAGVSAIWGCKRWPDMAISLVDECYDEGKISYWEKKILLDKYQYNPRKLITIAKDILNEKYLEKLKKTIEPSKKKKERYQDLFKKLASLNTIFITTNIDTHLSEQLSKPQVHHNNFQKDLLQPKNCFHLHGRIDEESSLVMTIDEYIDKYKNNTKFSKFLEHIFWEDEYALLFIGYGVDELELIDYMIEKYDSEKSKQSSRSGNMLNRYYIFMPTFNNEETLLRYEKLYFNKLRMEIIPYAIDNNGYEQLYEVINTWVAELIKPDDNFYKLTKLIDDNK